MPEPDRVRYFAQSVIADENLFYIHDTNADFEQVDDLWSAEAERQRIACQPGLIGVLTASDGEVPVTFAIAAHATEDRFADWDHVVEAGLDLPSGTLELSSQSGTTLVGQVRPGFYRTRIHIAGLAELEAADLEAEERYHVLLYPGAPHPVRVLKQWQPAAEYGNLNTSRLPEAPAKHTPLDPPRLTPSAPGRERDEPAGTPVQGDPLATLIRGVGHLLSAVPGTQTHDSDRLLAILEHAGPGRQRTMAALAIRSTGDKRAVTPLLRMVKADPDPNARILAAHALGGLADPQAIGPLAAVLKNEDARIGQALAGALAQFGAAAVEPLIDVLETGTDPARIAAIQGLALIGDARASGALAATLADRDSKLRLAAVRALGTLGNATVLAAVTACARNDPVKKVRQAAAAAHAAIESRVHLE